jgi:fatty acid desaturase
LAQPFRCNGCGTELKIAGSTIWTALLLVIPFVIVVTLAKPWIGRGGVIALGIIGGHLLPWIAFHRFYKLEPTGTALDLNAQDRSGPYSRK